MKIGIMARTMEEKAGIGLYTVNLLDNLFRIDRDHRYVLFHRGSPGLDRYDGYPNVERVRSPVASKLLWDHVVVPWLAGRHRVDVLFNAKFSVPLLARRPTAMVVHGSAWFVHPEHYKKIDVLYEKTMMRAYVRKARAVLCVSERARRDMIRYVHGDPDRLHTIHLAPNERFRVIDDGEALGRMRARYDLPEKFILWVGGIYPQKNVGNLIRAYGRIAGEVPHELVLAGEPRWNHRADLAWIERLGLGGRVQLRDWVPPDDLPAFYNLADAFVFPSWYESCPTPPWEAMACGCPVVTCRTGGTPEVVGDAALYVEPGSVEGIAEGIRAVLTDAALRADLVEKGFRTVRRFTWEQTARKTLAVLESLGPGGGVRAIEAPRERA